MNIVTIVGDKQLDAKLGEQLRIEATYGVIASRMLDQLEREMRRPVDAPDRPSVKRAMEAVEAQIVSALWTLARLPDRNPFGKGRCGLDYVHDRQDKWDQAMANGGKWVETPPRPALPSSRSIDAMEGPLSWLSWLPREQGQFVSVCASTKRGNARNRISWPRVREALPETRVYSTRTLQRRYEAAVRAITAILQVQ